MTLFSELKFRNLTVKNRIFRSNISGRFDLETGRPTQTRINWETMFARGGAGAIISSYVPVLMAGRIIAGYATIHTDEFIKDWEKLGQQVHKSDCKYIMQLSHSGRQMDLPGIHNQHRASMSSTSVQEGLHGFPCNAMNKAEIAHTVDAFGKAAWRAREAGLDGVELHAANGYLFTQFLSSAINDRRDEYGGDLFNRSRFLLDVIRSIRSYVGRDFHLQVKLSSVDYNNVLPWEKPGNRLHDTIKVAKWVENVGADALHMSIGSLFPHPLNPPGDFDFNTITATYDAMISSGSRTFRNYLLFRYPMLRPVFRWLWFRQKKHRPFEGVSSEETRAIRHAVSIPVISTGGYQDRDLAEQLISSGGADGISMARALVANPDLPRLWQSGERLPERPCTFCNKCLLNAPKNPMGCYELDRYDGDYEKMVATICAVFETPDKATTASKAGAGG